MSAPARPLLVAVAAQVGTLALAFAGGAVFAALGVPAAWLSGAMIVSAIAAGLGVIPPMPPAVRDFSMLVAGISLGMGVTPEALAAIWAYPASLALLGVGVIAIMVSSTVALVRLNGWQPRDAFFASAPGSLAAVMIIAAELRADVPRITVVQACRLFFLVMVLPSLITAVETAQEIPPPSGPLLSPIGLAVLFAVSLIAAVLLGKLRIAAPLIMGAMLASALLTGSGGIAGRMPQPITTLGFVVIGCFIGQRFRGMQVLQVARLLPAILVSLVTTLTVAGLFAALVSMVVGVPIGETVVAFAPGGLEAMTVLSLALGLDPLYVSVHHLCRFVLVGVLVPVALKYWPGLSPKAHDPKRL